jgi:branched-chain amino acid transport system ATP-binding protein
MLERVGLATGHGRQAGTLPLGLKKRLEIARALALDPSLLLLDEPSGGLRHEESQQLLELIRRLNHGVRIAEGDPAAIRRNPLVIEAYLGRGSA